MKRNTLALVVATALFTVTSSAYAIIDKGYSAVYYSDATFTEEVGEGGMSCANNKFMFWGVRTAYFIKFEEIDCCVSCLPYDPIPR